MNGKASRRILSTVIAIALVLTSGIGVFAADSPTGGKTTAAGTVGNLVTAVNTGNNTIALAWEGTASQYQIWVNGTVVAVTSDKNYVLPGKANGRYDIAVKAVDGDSVTPVVKRWIKKTSKAKAKKQEAKR